MTAPFSVIIPAHNEEAVIARCLEALLEQAPADALPEIIVAANGCSDATVEVARAAAPCATVLDLPQGSKSAAMNEGSRLATVTPRFFLDADVQCSYASLAATAAVLREPGVMVASPALRMDLSRSDALVRAHYRVWQALPYATDRMVGSGLFGLSADGLQRMGPFPPIFGDDIWVRTRFGRDERRNVSRDGSGAPVFFIVSPPRRWSDLVRIEARRRVGDEEVRRLFPSPHTARINGAGSLATALAAGASAFDMVVYAVTKACAQARYRWNRAVGRAGRWDRDLGARELA